MQIKISLNYITSHHIASHQHSALHNIKECYDFDINIQDDQYVTLLISSSFKVIRHHKMTLYRARDREKAARD